MTDTDPTEEPSIENSTEPDVTVTAVAEATWAVKVTDWPKTDALWLLEMTVVVGTRATLWLVVAELPMKLPFVA